MSHTSICSSSQLYLVIEVYLCLTWRAVSMKVLTGCWLITLDLNRDKTELLTISTKYVLRPLLWDISVVKKPFTPRRKRGILVYYLIVTFVPMDMLLIFENLCLSSLKHQLHHEAPNAVHHWVQVHAFKSPKLAHCNALLMAYLTAHSNCRYLTHHPYKKEWSYCTHRLPVNLCIIL